MSKPSITKITCPTCQHTVNATLWMSVTSTLDPQLKTRVLDGTLFDHSCPKCHQPLRMEHDFIYSDPVRKFMLTMKLPKDGEPPTVSTGLLDGMAGLLQGARLRIVTSFKQLREKILIFDADLSDELIELLKLVVWQQTFGTADVSDDSVFSFRSELGFFARQNWYSNFTADHNVWERHRCPGHFTKRQSRKLSVAAALTRKSENGNS